MSHRSGPAPLAQLSVGDTLYNIVITVHRSLQYTGNGLKFQYLSGGGGESVFHNSNTRPLVALFTTMYQETKRERDCNKTIG